MLVIVNGNYKTGSTRIFTFFTELFCQYEIPAKLQAPHNVRNYQIYGNEHHLLEISNSKNVVIKTHDYFLLFNGVKAIGDCFHIYTKRRYHDVFQSHRYHFEKDRGRSISFFWYALLIGYPKMLEAMVYQDRVEQCADLVLDYHDFEAELPDLLLRFIMKNGLAVSAEEVRNAWSRSDMRGKSINNVQGSVAGRDWFTNRPERRMTPLQRFTMNFVIRVALLSSKIPMICRVFQIFRSRQYRRHVENC